MITKLFMSLFVSSLCFLNVSLPIIKEKQIKQNINIKYTMQDEFDDNEILLVLDNEESLLFKEYSVNDFKSIGALKVEDLTKIYTKEKVYNTHIQNPLENKRYISNFNKILKITLNQKNKQNVLNKVNILNKLDFVEYAEPNFFIEAELQSASNPNDPNINQQWAIQKIQLDDAWEIESGNSEVKVGILDTGIDCDHVDLNDNINTSLCHTYDNELNFPVLEDHFGHGTDIAGIIGAEGDNGIGITGVCQDVTMVSIKITNEDRRTPNSEIVDEAINYAESNEIGILNMSFSGNYHEAVNNAIENYAGLIIASAGNDGKNIDLLANEVYPACYNFDNIITVGASNIDDNLWNDYIPGTYAANTSNYGATTVDLFAPGEDIYTTNRNGGYSTVSGTSFAAPFVTGVAALIKSYAPDLTPLQIKQVILSNVDKFDTTHYLYDKCVSKGRLNAYKAVYNCVHRHDYTNRYAWRDGSQHLAYCECGAYRLEGHAIRTGTKKCIKCNGNVTGGFIEMRSNLLLPTTLNGSYILPNGIIVLVEEDIEAYLNNTLVFYKKDEELY